MKCSWRGRFRASWAPAEVLRLLKAAARFEMRNFRLKDEAQAVLPDSDGAGTVSAKVKLQALAREPRAELFFAV